MLSTSPTGQIPNLDRQDKLNTSLGLIRTNRQVMQNMQVMPDRPHSLRDPSLCSSSFRRGLKTVLFAKY